MLKVIGMITYLLLALLIITYHSSIKMAPYEAMCGGRCRSPIGWFEVGEVELLGPYLVYQTIEKVKLIQERLKKTQSHQNVLFERAA